MPSTAAHELCWGLRPCLGRGGEGPVLRRCDVPARLPVGESPRAPAPGGDYILRWTVGARAGGGQRLGAKARRAKHPPPPPRPRLHLRTPPPPPPPSPLPAGRAARLASPLSRASPPLRGPHPRRDRRRGDGSQARRHRALRRRRHPHRSPQRWAPRLPIDQRDLCLVLSRRTTNASLLCVLVSSQVTKSRNSSYKTCGRCATA